MSLHSIECPPSSCSVHSRDNGSVQRRTRELMDGSIRDVDGQPRLFIVDHFHLLLLHLHFCSNFQTTEGHVTI